MSRVENERVSRKDLWRPKQWLPGVHRITAGCVALALSVAGSALAVGPEVCGSGGGPTVCVRFDDRQTAPQATVDYVFDFSDPNAPSVELRRGEDMQGTVYAWRVWSKSAQGAPADIGSITAPGGFSTTMCCWLSPTALPARAMSDRFS